MDRFGSSMVLTIAIQANTVLTPPVEDKNIIRWFKRDWNVEGSAPAKSKNGKSSGAKSLVQGLGASAPGEFGPFEALLGIDGFGQTIESQKLFYPNGMSFMSYSIQKYRNHDTKKGAFTCPGDSVMTGMMALWDLVDPQEYVRLWGKRKIPHVDRTMQYRCQFFEDGLGRPVKRQNCSWRTDTSGNDAAANHLRGDLYAACPKDQFLAGHRSEFDTSKKDYLHRVHYR